MMQIYMDETMVFSTKSFSFLQNILIEGWVAFSKRGFQRMCLANKEVKIFPKFILPYVA